MRRAATALALVILAAFGVGAGVRAQPLVTDLSKRLIAITSNFKGTDLLLFGAVPAEARAGAEGAGADIVVVIRGPKENLVVRRKDRVGGIWINRAAVTFRDVPGYYAVLSNRRLSEIAPPGILARHSIGLENLKLAPAEPSDDWMVFRDALIRKKRQNDLYAQREGAVTFLSGTLFRTDVRFPANVPDGDYRAEVYLFRDGEIESAHSSPLFIDKIGLERRIYGLAHRRPVIYGLIAIALAVIAGWLAAVTFRRS